MATKVELYRFESASESWYFTSADRDIESGGIRYLAAAGLQRGSLRSMGSVKKADLEITAARDNPLVVRYTSGRPSTVVSLTIFQDTWPDPAPVVAWKGRVVGVTTKDARAVITCESIFTSLARPGLRAMYQLLCRHGLYQPGCNLDPAAFRVTGDVVAVDGAVVTVAEAAGHADGYFTAGYVVAGGEYAMITAHAGSQITVDKRVILPGTTAWLHPGCDHTRQQCNDRFGNVLNYGGYPWVPLRTPFGGGESFMPGGTVGA